MSLRLPPDLSYLVLSHLPTTQIEQYAPFLTDNSMNMLARVKYGFIDPNPRYSALDNYPRMFPARLLNYLRIAAYHGDIGHYSYLIVGVQVSCILAIQRCDRILLRYYLYMLDLPIELDFIKLLVNVAISYLPNNDEYKNLARYLQCFYITCDSDFKSYSMSDVIDHIRNDYSNPFTVNKEFSAADPLLWVLLQFDLTKIKQYSNQSAYPPAWSRVDMPLLFTQEFVDKCKEIYVFVTQNMASSPALDDYLILLQIILNQDFDLDKLSKRYLIYFFTSIGASLGIDRIDKILPAARFNLIYSQVIYNPQNYLKLKKFTITSASVVDASLWLSGNQMLIYNSDDSLSADIEHSKNIELSDKLGKNINQPVNETSTEDRILLNYAEEANILLSMFEVLNRYDYLDIDPANYYQYSKMKQYGINANIHLDGFTNKYYFTDADELYELISE